MAANDTQNDQPTYTLRLTDVAQEPQRFLLPIEGYEDMPLVTLEDAVQPINHLFHEIKNRVYIAKRNCETCKGSLTPDAAASIMLYTMPKSGTDQAFYYILNSILRSDQPDRSDQLKPWFLYLKLFITALSYIPSYRGTIYRGVKLDLSEYYTVGKKFVWWGFSSCTKSLSVLQSELFLGHEGVGTLFIIDCFSGKEIRHYSYFEKEDEVLLVAARHFRVIGHLNPKPHLWIIQIKEIDPPFPFLKTDSSISSTLERSFPDKTFDSHLLDTRSMTHAETQTDDISSNIKLSEGAPTDAVSTVEKEDQLKKSVDVTTASPPALTNSAVLSKDTTTDTSIAIVTPSNVDELAAAADNQQHAQAKTMWFKNQLISKSSAEPITNQIRENLILEILYFRNNALKDVVFDQILQTLDKRIGLKLFITDNSITDESAKLLANFLSKSPKAIVQLHLERNELTSQGVQILAQALAIVEGSDLRALGFSGNRLIDDECIDDVIHLCERNQRLKSLYLDRCNLSDKGKQRLKTALAAKKAFSLQL